LSDDTFGGVDRDVGEFAAQFRNRRIALVLNFQARPLDDLLGFLAGGFARLALETLGDLLRLRDQRLAFVAAALDLGLRLNARILGGNLSRFGGFEAFLNTPSALVQDALQRLVQEDPEYRQQDAKIDELRNQPGKINS
jgi:hypothetical protein